MTTRHSIHRTGPDHWSPQGPSGLTPDKIRGPIAPMHESTFAKWRRVRRQAKLIGEPSLSVGTLVAGSAFAAGAAWLFTFFHPLS